MLLGVTARAHPALHAKLVADRAVSLLCGTIDEHANATTTTS